MESKASAKKSYILAGMQFGDEGKGSFVDYIASAHNIKQAVRYNGGSQASHTVITPQGTLHKFSQLSSAMFLDDRQTYITSNMVINPFNLVEEAVQFAAKTYQEPKSVLGKVKIDENCYIVTPYHKLINQMREICAADARRGSVGTGVSEVRRLFREQNIGIQIKDLCNHPLLSDKLNELYIYAKKFYDANQKIVFQELPDDIRYNLSKGIHFLFQRDSITYFCKEYQTLIEQNAFIFSHNICADLQLEDGIVFEGAQGLLIDEAYGFKPTTTILDTTITAALNLCKQLGITNFVKAGVAKAFTSRHGIGVFPTESAELNASIVDTNQESSYWNGAIRFGWFDAVLMRYAQAVNDVDEIYLSSVDKLDSLATIKICNSYQYFGERDDEFKSAFEYEIDGGCAVISNIKENTKNISGYLSQCVPVYIDIKGWECKTAQIRQAASLPQNCRNYIAQIERLSNIKVSVISVGAARNEKLVV